jgi:hypothetical protein
LARRCKGFLPLAAWPAVADRCEAVDLELPDVGETGSALRQLAQEATLLGRLHEVEHAAARIARLDLAIKEAVKVHRRSCER